MTTDPARSIWSLSVPRRDTTGRGRYAERGMAEKSAEFIERGADVYVEV